MFEKKIIKAIPLIILTLLFSSCDRLDTSEMQEGVIKDMSNLNGCGYVVQLNNGTILEVENLHEFNIDIENNKDVWVKYQSNPLICIETICQLGEVVSLEDMIER
jgi:hypothetical protein